MNRREVLQVFVLVSAVATAVACSFRPSSEAEFLRWRMFQWSKWVGEHRGQLEVLVRDVGPYATLNSLDWPRLNRSRLSFPGRAPVRQRTPETFCPERRLYLEPEICVVLLNRRDAGSASRYASWADRGRDERGELWTNLGGGWYLCSDRTGSRGLGDPAGYLLATVPPSGSRTEVRRKPEQGHRRGVALVGD